MNIFWDLPKALKNFSLSSWIPQFSINWAWKTFFNAFSIKIIFLAFRSRHLKLFTCALNVLVMPERKNLVFLLRGWVKINKTPEVIHSILVYTQHDVDDRKINLSDVCELKKWMMKIFLFFLEEFFFLF